MCSRFQFGAAARSRNRIARGSPEVVIVNESMARQFWPNGDAIGKQIQLGATNNSDHHARQIVGIAGDVRERTDTTIGTTI
jgi:hypothetical protein